MTTSAWDERTWPLSEIAEAIGQLGTRSGLLDTRPELPASLLTPEEPQQEQAERYLDLIARQLGVEVDPVEAPYPEVEQLIAGAGPALLRLPGAEATRFLALLGRRGRLVALLRPDGQEERLPASAIRALLCGELEAPALREIEQVLERSTVPAGRRSRTRDALLRERLREYRVQGCCLIRLSAGAPLIRQLRHAGIPRLLAGFVGAHMLYYALWLLSWWLIGRGVLQGHVERSWLLAWALVLLSMVPLRMLETWWQSRLSIAAGTLLKQRLLYGALRLHPEELRHEGIGRFLGRIIESEAVESLTLKGGFFSIVAGVELALAATVIALGPHGTLHVLALVGWIALALLITWRYYAQRLRWTGERLAMTHGLIENMVGYRTRLAQEQPERWHSGEDQALARYVAQSRRLDRWGTMIQMVPSRAWLLLSLLVLLPAFLSGTTALGSLAVGLGGMLSAYLALRKLSPALLYSAAALIAWRQIADLFQTAGRPEGLATGLALRRGRDEDGRAGQPLLEANGLTFRYDERHRPVLQGCDLLIRRGDRVLLEGPSGGGKSTLVSLLNGLRRPQSGLVLLDGLDLHSVGSAGWRRQVVSAPQFHENHVFTESFAFNLLMGRRWPPTLADMQQAEELCRELGLGPLLDRMPGGMMQMVGESGWQLSHGERSRLYIARALLQGADMILLDESFGALDPEMLERALRCVLDRAPTLLVIAHP